MHQQPLPGRQLGIAPAGELLADQGQQQPFQVAPLLLVAEHPRGEGGAVDRAVRGQHLRPEPLCYGRDHLGPLIQPRTTSSLDSVTAP